MGISAVSETNSGLHLRYCTVLYRNPSPVSRYLRYLPTYLGGFYCERCDSGLSFGVGRRYSVPPNLNGRFRMHYHPARLVWCYATRLIQSQWQEVTRGSYPTCRWRITVGSSLCISDTRAGISHPTGRFACIFVPDSFWPTPLVPSICRFKHHDDNLKLDQQRNAINKTCKKENMTNFTYGQSWKFHPPVPVLLKRTRQLTPPNAYLNTY